MSYKKILVFCLIVSFAAISQGCSSDEVSNKNVPDVSAMVNDINLTFRALDVCRHNTRGNIAGGDSSEICKNLYKAADKGAYEISADRLPSVEIINTHTKLIQDMENLCKTKKQEEICSRFNEAVNHKIAYFDRDRLPSNEDFGPSESVYDALVACNVRALHMRHGGDYYKSEDGKYHKFCRQLFESIYGNG